MHMRLKLASSKWNYAKTLRWASIYPNTLEIFILCSDGMPSKTKSSWQSRSLESFQPENYNLCTSLGWVGWKNHPCFGKLSVVITQRKVWNRTCAHPFPRVDISIFVVANKLWATCGNMQTDMVLNLPDESCVGMFDKNDAKKKHFSY